MTLSFSKNRWRLKPEAPESLYAEKPDIHRVILQLLYNRKIENIEDFLKLDYDTQVHDPFLFKNMKKAVKRLFQAIKKKRENSNSRRL